MWLALVKNSVVCWVSSGGRTGLENAAIETQMAGIGIEGRGDGGIHSFCLYVRHAVSISLPVVRHTFSVLIITRGYVKLHGLFLFIQGWSYREEQRIGLCSTESLNQTTHFQSIKFQIYT